MHRYKLNSYETNKRLNILHNFNILSDVHNGTYPTPGELIKINGFGKPSQNQSFRTDTHFDHIVLPLLKSGLLDAQQIIIIAQTAKFYAHLIKTIMLSVEIDLHPLAKYNLKYSEQ